MILHSEFMLLANSFGRALITKYCVIIPCVYYINLSLIILISDLSVAMNTNRHCGNLLTINFLN